MLFGLLGDLSREDPASNGSIAAIDIDHNLAGLRAIPTLSHD